MESLSLSNVLDFKCSSLLSVKPDVMFAQGIWVFWNIRSSVQLLSRKVFFFFFFFFFFTFVYNLVMLYLEFTNYNVWMADYIINLWNLYLYRMFSISNAVPYFRLNQMSC